MESEKYKCVLTGGTLMSIKITYDEVLSDPKLINESRAIKEMLDWVWDGEELT